MKNNIGIVTTWFERGAAYVSRQYMDIIKKKENVFIYVRGGENYAKDSQSWNLPNVTWGKKITMPKSVTNYIDPDDFKKWIDQNKIDLVFFNEQQYWQPVLLCKKMGIKTCSYVDYYTESTIPLFGLFDILLCNTKRHFEAFSWHKQAFYIPWGTQTHIFKPPEDKPIAPKGVVRFFHSAGMSPYRKGTDYVIKALESIINSGEKNVKLIIHLQTDIDRFFPNITRTISNLVKKGYLEIINKTVQTPGLYHRGDVYVYPSRLDGIGLTIAEALSCGLPVITPDNPPMNEFAQSKGCKLVKVNRLFARNDGYYWPQCEVDIYDLAEKMIFFSKHFSELKEFGQNAREYAIKNLNWDTNATDIVNILQRCEKLAPEEKLSNAATDFDNRKYYGITKIPWLFSLFVRAKRLIQSIQR